MKEYHSPATLRLSSVDNEYGLAIGAVVLWAIGNCIWMGMARYII